MHSLRVADLWLTSRERVERLTNAETVRLGRALIEASATGHVWYPDDAANATAVITNYAGELSSKARDPATEILGDFDSDLRDTRP